MEIKSNIYTIKDSERNFLFLIAIDNYKKLRKLNNCNREVREFKKVLFERYFFSSNLTYELSNDKATNKNIHDALRGYTKQITKNDNLIIYFSGHGEYDKKTDRGFWAPFNAIPDDISTFFSNADLIDYIKRIDELKKTELRKFKLHIESLATLKKSYSNIQQQILKGIYLNKIELKDCKFPLYNRATRKYIATQEKYIDIISNCILMINKLKLQQ